MNCDWHDIEKADERGWRRVQCTRCGATLHPTPHSLNQIFANCRGTPRWHEWGHWASLVFASVGITKERYGRWKWQLGFQPASGCGSCAERETKWNNAGSRLLIILQKASAFLRPKA